MAATIHPIAHDEPTHAAVPATYQIQVNGVWRDMLLVPEVAQRIYGAADKNACARVHDLISTGRLFACSTGRAYLIPVGSLVAFQRGEQYP